MSYHLSNSVVWEARNKIFTQKKNSSYHFFIRYFDFVKNVLHFRPKQEIDIELHAHVGIGRDHAKFSPVCTAFYRLLPTIDFKSKFCGEEAHKMKSFFSPGVVDIRMNESGQEEAFVKNARLDANTREVYRHQEYRVSDF